MIMHSCMPGRWMREAICETRWCYVSPSIQPRFGPHQTSIGLLQWRMSFVDESLGLMTRLQSRWIWQTPPTGILPTRNTRWWKGCRKSRKIMFLNKVTDYSYTKFGSFQSIFVRIDYVRLEISEWWMCVCLGFHSRQLVPLQWWYIFTRPQCYNSEAYNITVVMPICHPTSLYNWTDR